MDIKKFNFPKPNLCLPTEKKLLDEATSRGFLNGYRRLPRKPRPLAAGMNW